MEQRIVDETDRRQELRLIKELELAEKEIEEEGYDEVQATERRHLAERRARQRPGSTQSTLT